MQEKLEKLLSTSAIHLWVLPAICIKMNEITVRQIVCLCKQKSRPRKKLMGTNFVYFFFEDRTSAFFLLHRCTIVRPWIAPIAECRAVRWLVELEFPSHVHTILFCIEKQQTSLTWPSTTLRVGFISYDYFIHSFLLIHSGFFVSIFFC